MEGRGHGSSLPDRHGIGAFSCEDLHLLAHMLDPGGADENHFQRRFPRLAFDAAEQLSLTDRTVDLAAVGVAPDADIERAQPGLRWILNLAGQQNRSGASAECWLESNELFQLFKSIFA